MKTRYPEAVRSAGGMKPYCSHSRSVFGCTPVSPARSEVFRNRPAIHPPGCIFPPPPSPPPAAALKRSREGFLFRPPVFDAPETTGLFDDKADALFSADCFGAVVRELHQDAAEIPADELCRDQTLWATFDAPWLHGIVPAALARALESVRRIAPDVILSSHLPPARGMTDLFLQTIVLARAATPFVGPGQAAFEAAMALTHLGPVAP